VLQGNGIKGLRLFGLIFRQKNSGTDGDYLIFSTNGEKRGVFGIESKKTACIFGF